MGERRRQTRVPAELPYFRWGALPRQTWRGRTTPRLLRRMHRHARRRAIERMFEGDLRGCASWNDCAKHIAHLVGVVRFKCTCIPGWPVMAGCPRHD